ncbi:5'/3'-nucleotidase SurE [Sphingomonas oligophenolica]|uniref:5'-nucleotidase SurE n=1 Tax=Sphingomonas oligophenolica TaxID=301154 RepID=A0ABU9Y9H1_9SPHN
MALKHLAALFALVVACAAAPVRAATPATPSASPPCRLLLDNDDGIGAPGIHALYDALKDMCALVVVAPANEQSGMSQAVPHFSKGLPVRAIAFADGMTGYAVEGSPAEAACLGILAMSDGKPFDLLISGINAGENTGLGNLYSGTVNAGIEALVRGTPSIAFSLSDEDGDDYSKAVPVVRALVREALARRLPPGVMLNVNIPKDYDGIVVLPSRGLSAVLTGFTASRTPNGDTLYKPNITYPNPSPPPGGDVQGYFTGHKVTVTPLAMDRTATEAIDIIKGWPLTIAP